jgi:D-sedoheptulose 7-phosphate isomerase
MTYQDFIENYLAKQQQVLSELPKTQIAKLILVFEKAWHENRQIFACGNGGSAANASHFITDLSKGASDQLGKPFRGMSLNDNTPWITALGNDYAYEDIFVRQLMNFAHPGDLFMGLSVSGNSPNVVKATSWAKENGLFTIALTGAGDNQLAHLAEFVIQIPDQHFGRVEDLQMGICHLICYAFIEGVGE